MTGITVCYNTKDLIKRAYESVRKFHPSEDIIIIDGSDENNPCFEYVYSLRNEAKVFQLKTNIGHGRGMHLALHKCETKQAFIFDSDIVMLKSPLREMKALLKPEDYGAGWVYEIGRDGFDFGTFPHHKEAIPYLHPYFMLLNVDQYFQYHPFVHHGAPSYKAMIDLHDKGHSDKLKQFQGLTGHTSGRGINWNGKPSEYIQHDFGGTRSANKQAGRNEIVGQWER